ncbi:SDR family oxidoreductase [Paeniglutamicibacter psychrophenolicus]|uniref:NAD(P)-dependent dehydrogenase (Short-subunit alcohol dehydrogenase family) n=1 Tax=Paeniglutamicibacter psychrophenolicus TaxID=257454 RepID=A0ABS4W942_9MICC|nr:SDR family oxidoreductase [Paeniglutamicibacter psychrophenolicus]MBP2372721.1 NAD(P)-dependent dehydrogenase (short-subunit alcohol dehydrogenase family) [Paeniglutamicibacter psychrophenolicus]
MTAPKELATPAARTILVTGAGSGIGKAVTGRMLKAGWNVVLAGRRNLQLEQSAAGHPNALAVSSDITDPAAVEKLFNAGIERFGKIDVLFNNAGIFGPSATIGELTAQQWQEVCAVNLSGAMYCAGAAFRHMQETGGGRVINNGSISAQVPRPASVAYAVTKHAITGLTKSIELDGRPYGITCSQIDIGNAASDMMRDVGATSGALQADGSRKVEPTFDMDQASAAIEFMASAPAEVSVNQVTITAAGMPFVGRG